jgi:hypothetical protein
MTSVKDKIFISKLERKRDTENHFRQADFEVSGKTIPN